MCHPLIIAGMPGSPYSRKLRAVLRFRRIPHRWVLWRSREARDLPAAKVPIMPVLIFPDECGEPARAAVDSTPLIRELESLYPERSVVPPDPALAFLDALIEDYADEWLTKAMFHYRWAFEDDIARAQTILPLWSDPSAPEEQLQAMGRVFAERQIERRWVVGSSDATAPLIEASYLRLLALLEGVLRERSYVLGARPGSADFGLYGQLTQLVLFDPTPAALAREHAPRVVAWTERVDDLSGAWVSDGDWLTRAVAPDALRPWLDEIGRVYAPFLLANAQALEKGADEVTCRIDGEAWVQRPFPYQARCLAALRQARGELQPDDRAVVDAALVGTGCEALFE